MNLTTLSDEELLQLITRRDGDAFETLYDRHAPLVYNVILRIVGDVRLAEEVVQECFWQVWQKASDFRGTGAGAAWLYRIARNRGLDRLRQQQTRPQTLELAAAENATVSRYGYAPSVELTVEQRWQQQQVRQSLASIPEEQRLILELAYFEGMTQSEIADYLALPLGTIKSRLRLGVEKLERLLAASGLRKGDF